MNTLLTNWSFMRFLRLALGIMIGVQAIQTQAIFPGVIAGFLLFQVITNSGCCGVNSCTKSNDTIGSGSITDVEFEEVKNK